MGKESIVGDDVVSWHWTKPVNYTGVAVDDGVEVGDGVVMSVKVQRRRR